MSKTKTKFELPALPYEFDALEPAIDAKTMKIHHGKHHQGYVNKLNKALEGHDQYQDKSLEELLRGWAVLPQDLKGPVRKHGGGHANHSLFWQILKPGGASQPQGALAKAFEKKFGSMETFKEKFKKAATGQFGSGWAWLVKSNGELKIRSTANQDNPLMDGEQPLLGLDVWEHAYYLKYQNRRGDYVDAFFELINWDEVGKRF